MPFSLDHYIQELKSTRLMRNNQEIDRFEVAMNKIYEQKQVKFITALCTGFDDNTEHEEVTWSLVHAIEDFYSDNPEEYDRIFLDIIDKNILIPHATGWLELLVTRTINDEHSRETFKDSLKHATNYTKQVIIDILNKLIEEDPKQFRDSCIEILSIIK